MTRFIHLAQECGIQYYLCPEGTTEMHGFDREVEAFALRVAQEERERLLELMSDKWGLTRDYYAESLGIHLN